MDAGTPQNPNKPRLSRRLLSHFTLTLSVLLALSFVTLAVVGPTTEKAEAIAPIVIVGAIAVGATIGWIANELTSNRDNAAISTYDLDDYLLSMGLALKDKSNIVNGVVGDYYQSNIDLMQYLFIHHAQWAARELYLEQNASSEEFVYDQYYILEKSTVAESLYAFYDYATQQYEALFNPYSSIGTTFSGNFDGGKYGLFVDLDVDKCFYVNPSTPYSNVDIKNGIVHNSYYYYNSTPTIYGFITPNPSTVFSLEDTDGNKLFNYTITTSNDGVQKIETGLDSGIYKITYSTSPTTSVLFADATPVLTSVANPTFGYSRGITESLNWNWSSSVGNLDKVHWVQKSPANKYGISYLPATSATNVRFGFAETDTMSETSGFANSSRTIDVKTILDNMDGLNEKLAEITTNINNFAQTYYNGIVATGDPGLDYGLPLMLFPDPSQMDGMTWEQIYALYVAYLREAYSYYQEHASDLDARMVNISAESLKLKIRGSIVNQTGVTLYDNTTVYSPFVTTEGVNLAIGKNDWESAAYAIKWGNANNLSNFTTTNATSIIDLEPGYTLYIQEIIFDGEIVDEIELTVSTVHLTVIDGSTPPSPPQTINDLDWLLSRWYYFAIVAGIICLLAAISFRNMAIIAVGVILIAAGGIGYWMAGDFSILDWFSMEPPNLRTWLQGLR